MRIGRRLRSVARPTSRLSASLTEASLRPTPALEMQPSRSIVRLSLHTIRDNEGARRPKKRVGRGGERGKTSGKGHKGAKARSGYSLRRGFVGGSTPFWKRTPIVRPAYHKVTAKPLTKIHLGRIATFVEEGRIDPRLPITMKVLHDSGVLKQKIKHGVKLQAGGVHLINYPLHFEVSRVSPTAKAAIEKAGGSVKTVFFNDRTLQAHLHPTKFAILPARQGWPKPKQAKFYKEYMDEQLASGVYTLKNPEKPAVLRPWITYNPPAKKQ